MINKYYIEVKKSRKLFKEKIILYLYNPFINIYNIYINYFFKSNKDNEPFFKYLNQNYDNNDEDIMIGDSPNSNNDDIISIDDNESNCDESYDYEED